MQSHPRLSTITPAARGPRQEQAWQLLSPQWGAQQVLEQGHDLLEVGVPRRQRPGSRLGSLMSEALREGSLSRSGTWCGASGQPASQRSLG